MGRRSLEAGERLDPLGFPPGFVPFIFSPGGAGETNFLQVHAGFAGTVAAAAADAEAARTATRTYETSVMDLRAQLNAIDSSTRTRLVTLCGAMPGSPSTPNPDCGAASGELATARSVHAEAMAAVETARARLDGLEARIAIEQGRIARVAMIRAETIEFIDSTNSAINIYSHLSVVFQAIRDALEVSSNANLLNGFSSIGMGVAVGIITGIQGEIAIQQDMLRQAQDLRVRSDESRIEVINGMTALAELTTQVSEVGLMISEALLRAATAAIQARSIEDQVAFAQAEQALLVEQLTSSLVNDPSVRAIRDAAVSDAINSLDEALSGAYLAARAYEHETNTDLTDIETALVPALNATEVRDFYDCLPGARTRFATAYGATQMYTDEISIREDVFGIRGPVTDPFTGEVLSEAEQFHRILLAPGNLRAEGLVLTFATTLSRGNGLFRTTSCNDQIRSITARIVGDGLGDDQADISLAAVGVETMRGCESRRDGTMDVIRTWDVQPGVADIAAGVNVYPTTAPNTLFTGRSVANSEWELGIPLGASHPRNADLDFSRIDDIVIRLDHDARSLMDSPVTYDPMCGD
jgi:hypothetical protein